MVFSTTDDAKNSFRSLATVAVLLPFLLGCPSEKEKVHLEAEGKTVRQEPSEESATNLPQTNVTAETSMPLTGDQRKVAEMNAAIDNGETHVALRMARELMDSKDAAVRMAVTDALGFIGKRALPDIEAMLGDPDGEVAQSALNAWELGLTELNSDRVRAAVVERAVKSVANRAMLDAILIQLTGIDEKLALTTLQRIIQANSGKAASVCAKSMFEHIAGEPWDSPERLLELLKEL